MVQKTSGLIPKVYFKCESHRLSIHLLVLTGLCYWRAYLQEQKGLLFSPFSSSTGTFTLKKQNQKLGTRFLKADMELRRSPFYVEGAVLCKQPNKHLINKIINKTLKGP